MLPHRNVRVLVRERVHVELVAAFEDIIAVPGWVHAGSKLGGQGDATPDPIDGEDGYQRLPFTVDVAFDAVEVVVLVGTWRERREPFNESEVLGKVLVVGEEGLFAAVWDAEDKADLSDAIIWWKKQVSKRLTGTVVVDGRHGRPVSLAPPRKAGNNGAPCLWEAETVKNHAPCTPTCSPCPYSSISAVLNCP